MRRDPLHAAPAFERLEGRRLLSQTPYLGDPFDLTGDDPVRVEAEFHDAGDPGDAYLDSDLDSRGDAFRPTQVDYWLGTKRDAVGYVADGEWLEYTVDVPLGGASYDVTYRLKDGREDSTLTLSGADGRTLASADIAGGGVWGGYETGPLGTIDLPGGTQALRVTFAGDGDNLLNFDWLEFDRQDAPPPPPADQQPYLGSPYDLSRNVVRIQSEHHDRGDAGVAYFDTDVESRGDAFRPTQVDYWLGTKRDAVGLVAGGEWLEYTLDVPAGGGAYDVSLRAKTGPADLGVVVSLEDGPSLITADLLGNGSWDGYRARGLGAVSLPGGPQVLRVTVEGVGDNLVNLDWIEFDRLDSPPPPPAQSPFNGTAPVLGDGVTRVQAEHYDEGGQGVAFLDADPLVGQGNPLRADGVDGFVSPERTVVGFVTDGEWLEYSLDVPAGGASYDVTYRAKTGREQFDLTLGLEDGPALLSDTRPGGAWSGYDLLDLGRVALPGGRQVVRVSFDAAVGGAENLLNFDWVEFERVAVDAPLSAKLASAGMRGVEKARQIGDRFVDYVDDNGIWVTTDVNGWTAGYTPGQMWEALEFLGRRGIAAPDLLQTAEGASYGLTLTFPSGQDAGHRLLPALPDYAAAVADGRVGAPFGDPGYVDLKLDADADVKQWSYNEVVGAYPAAWRQSDSGDPRANFGVLLDMTYDLVLVQRRIDTAVTEGRVDYSDTLKERVARAGRLAARDFLRADGSTYQWAYYNAADGDLVSRETYQGLADDSAWSRGQAWAILSFAELAAGALDDPSAASYDPAFAADMADAARRAADYFVANLPPDGVPLWDFDAPAGDPTDTSAAAIASYGLQVLADVVGGAEADAYRDAAGSMLEALIDDHLVPPSAPGDLRQGLLDGGSGNVPAGVAVETPLVFGDYWLMRSINEWESREGI